MPPPPAEGFASRIFLGPALRAQPDRRLVSLVRQGYEAAFEEIVRRYNQALGRYAAAIVPRHRAEDVTQDAFSKALLGLRDTEAEIELRPWLYRIVRNTALNDLRDQPLSEELDEALPGPGSAHEEAVRREELRELMTRLRALPEPQRAAIVMRELEGLSHEEIAASLGLSGGGARQTIYRARRALRDGAGMLVPMPLLKALLTGGMVADAGATGASAAIGLKAAAATVLVAGTVGTGIAIEQHTGPQTQRADAATIARPNRGPGGDSGSVSGTGAEAQGSGPADTSGGGPGPGRENHDSTSGSGSGDGGGSSSSGPGGGENLGSSGHEGPGPSSGSGGKEGHIEQSGSGHSGPGGSEPSEGGSGSSGPGSGGFEEPSHSGLGSGSEGPGPSGSTLPPPPTELPEIETSGSGSSNSGPGSGGSGTSGSGSSGPDNPEPPDG